MKPINPERSFVAGLDSPVSNNGRGLKLEHVAVQVEVVADSPVSNNGRGLKQFDLGGQLSGFRDSPVSNNGRGLKLGHKLQLVVKSWRIRPLAITGVD